MKRIVISEIFPKQEMEYTKSNVLKIFKQRKPFCESTIINYA